MARLKNKTPIENKDVQKLEVNPLTFKLNNVKFKNQKQKDFFDLCKSDDTKLVICDGPAGTGKNYIALYAALKLLKSGKYDQILYVRSPVDSSDAGLGFLPGDLFEKTINYMLPLQEKLEKFMTVDKSDELIRNGLIDSCVNSYMRGRSIDNTLVLIDETQNFSINEMRTVLTRFEENTKIICLGDRMQSDIGVKSSLNKLLLMFESDEKSPSNGVFTFKFDIEDVVRSGLTKFVLEVFSKYDKIGRG